MIDFIASLFTRAEPVIAEAKPSETAASIVGSEA